MSSELISRSPDLKRLRDEGYEIEIVNGYLLAHVPYVDSNATVQRGVIATEVTQAGDVVAEPRDHTVHFVGGEPCHRDGTKLTGIRAGDSSVVVTPALVAKHHLSNKPNTSGYREPDFYVKMKRYIDIICRHAESLDPTVKAASFNVMETKPEESVFMYMDTASSRAGINAVSDKLKPITVAIIGLGGTGAYVLDLISKSPLKQIRLFDDDWFYSHNAFRAPAAASLEDLRQRDRKVAYYVRLYSKLHRHLVPHEVRIHEGNLELLDGVDFVFVCVDTGESRRLIAEYLVAKKVRFVDVGMGVQMIPNASMLMGTVRTTTSSFEKSDHMLAGKRVPMDPSTPDDAYKFNVQIADLNALNAVLAVIKFKKLFGVYEDAWREHHSTYNVSLNLLTSEERPDGA